MILAVAADIKYMKIFSKVAAVFFFVFMHGGLFAEDVPLLLRGLWQNDNRIVSFQNTSSMDIVLKLFYGWYYDRAAEAKEDVPVRPRNDATSIEAQEISVAFEPIIPENDFSGAWNVHLFYSSCNKKVVVPVAVFNGKLYTDFMILFQGEEKQRIFQSASNGSGITINLANVAENVYSFFDTGTSLYKIRYWQTGMDYDADAKAEFSDSDGTYLLQKHLRIGGTMYTCVPGRGNKIRNVEKVDYEKIKQFKFSEDERICVSGKEYLSLYNSDPKELYSDVEFANSRRRPPRSPFLPPPDVDFHYSTIEDLRKHAIVPLP